MLLYQTSPSCKSSCCAYYRSSASSGCMRHGLGFVFAINWTLVTKTVSVAAASYEITLIRGDRSRVWTNNKKPESQAGQQENTLTRKGQVPSKSLARLIFLLGPFKQPGPERCHASHNAVERKWLRQKHTLPFCLKSLG